MKRIAALYTCFNRKEKTLNSLRTLYQAHSTSENPFTLDVYLTDDGSTDGTSEAVKENYPKVHILRGDGNLFWAEGMRKSWQKAREKDYDGFLLLNDDVEIYETVFADLFATHSHAIENYKKSGIYIGPTEDKIKQKLTYSGSLILNRLKYTQKRLPPNGSFQKCDLANANIMLVAKPVMDEIGILSEGYSHGMADYDYTLTANKHNIPVLITQNYCGHCVDDHKNKYIDFEKKSFKERKQILYSPTGLAFDSYKRYMKKFFPERYPIIVFFGYFKLYFPKVYKMVLDR